MLSDAVETGVVAVCIVLINVLHAQLEVEAGNVVGAGTGTIGGPRRLRWLLFLYPHYILGLPTDYILDYILDYCFVSSKLIIESAERDFCKASISLAIPS